MGLFNTFIKWPKLDTWKLNYYNVCIRHTINTKLCCTISVKTNTCFVFNITLCFWK